MNFTLLENLISREPELKSKIKNVFIYCWNSINITATLEIKKNNLKCFLALGRNWANAQMPLEIKSRQKGKYSLVVQKGTDVDTFGNLHRSSFSKAQRRSHLRIRLGAHKRMGISSTYQLALARTRLLFTLLWMPQARFLVSWSLKKKKLVYLKEKNFLQIINCQKWPLGSFILIYSSLHQALLLCIFDRLHYHLSILHIGVMDLLFQLS